MKQQLDEINILRAIACLAVIFIHTSAEPVASLQSGSIHLTVFSLMNRTLQFAVPGFIFISGFVLFYKYGNKKFHFFSFVKKRLSAILIPYFIWTVIYYAVFIKAGYYSFSFNFFLKKLFLADMIYHLYFILLINQFYIIFGVLLYFYKKISPHLILGCLAFVNVLFLKFGYFQYADRFFMQYIFFFGLGCYISIYYQAFKVKLAGVKKYLFLVYVVVNSYFVYQFYQYYVLKEPISGFIISLTWLVHASISIIFVYYIALFINNKNYKIKGILDKISQNSYYIYLSHPFALMLSHKILVKLGYNSITGRFFLNSFIVCATIIPLSILYGSYREKLKIIKKSKINSVC